MLVCNNQLFIKPTVSGRTFIVKVKEASPYTGAKPYFLIEEQIEDSAWLGKLVTLTVAEMPLLKPRKKKKTTPKKS